MRLGHILEAHHRSFSQGAGRSTNHALLVLYGPGGIALVTLVVLKSVRPDSVKLDELLVADLAGGLALFAGIMFALAVALLGKAIELDLSRPAPSPTTSTAALRLQALAANSLWTAIMAGGVMGAIIAGSIFPVLACPMNLLATGALVVIGSSSIGVVKRVWQETSSRTDRARTGSSREEDQ